MQPYVKQCPGCSTTFAIDDFMGNPEIDAIGMQFEDPDLQNNMYYFNHECPQCGSTFVVSVLEFLPLIDEAVPEEILAGGPTCEGHCMRISDLAVCDSPCHYAPFRRFLLKLRRAAKTSSLNKADGPSEEEKAA